MEEKPPPQGLEPQVSFLPKLHGQTNFYPFYFENLLDQEQKHFYGKNGYLLLLKELKIEVASQLDQCRCLWDEFSPNSSLFDTWDFRLAFWKGYRNPFYFLMLKKGKEILGLLPIWYEEDNNKRYTWFGSNWQEENKFFAKDPVLVSLLLAICPSPLVLGAISLEGLGKAKEFVDFQENDSKYILDLRGFSSSKDFLSSLKKKKRYNFKRDKKRIEAQEPKIIFDNFSDFKSLVSLCKERFKQKGEGTDWDDLRRIETFRHVIEIGRKKTSFEVRMITVVLKGRIAAVDLIALFKGCYYPLKCAYDVSRFPGIGNFVNLLEIDDAISLGMKRVDFLEISYGWKERWFQPIPLLKYEKG